MSQPGGEYIAQNTSHMTYDDNWPPQLPFAPNLTAPFLTSCSRQLFRSTIRRLSVHYRNEIIREAETNWWPFSFLRSLRQCRLLHRLFLRNKTIFMNLPFRAEAAAASLHKEKEIRLRSCFNEIAVRSIEMRSIYGISTAFSDATRSDFSQIVDMWRHVSTRLTYFKSRVPFVAAIQAMIRDLICQRSLSRTSWSFCAKSSAGATGLAA